MNDFSANNRVPVHPPSVASALAFRRSCLALLVLPVALALLSGPASAFCLCLKCATGLWLSFQATSGSMEPAIRPGVCFYVNRSAEVDRGSSIVLRQPIQDGGQIVARLIGLPGDVVEIRGGKVLLNGSALPQRPVAPFVRPMLSTDPWNLARPCPETVEDGASCVSIPRSMETVPDGPSYEVLDVMSGSFIDDAGVFTIPPGHVFVLGDNRDNASDSRFDQKAGGLGFVPATNILGPVVEIGTADPAS